MAQGIRWLVLLRNHIDRRDVIVLTDEALYEQKCAALCKHVFESHPELDVGVNATA